MAQVAPLTDVSRRVDSYLPYLFTVLHALRDINEEWDTWDDYSQLDFVIDWDIKRDRLSQLAQWDQQGLLSPSQQEQYQRVLLLLAESDPILQRLLAD